MSANDARNRTETPTMEKMIDMARTRRARSSAHARRALAVAAVLCAPLGLTATAQADFGIVPGSFVARADDDLGAPLTQAGAHPNARTAFQLNTRLDNNGQEVPDQDLKDVVVDLPVGVVGNPTAAPACRMEVFASEGAPLCPTASQVGVIRLDLRGQVEEPRQISLMPVYNLVPRADQPARFGFRLGRNNVVIDARVRSESDYGITATIRNSPGGAIVYGADLTLWGVPASPVHDPQRFLPGASVPGDFMGAPLPAGVPVTAFFTNPTRCGHTPVTRIAVSSWQNPGSWATDSADAEVPTGCDRLLFDPSITFRPDTATAGAPSGYNVAIDFRQNDDPVGISPSALRTAVVRLPLGTVVSPSSADGLQACSPDQIGLRSAAAVTCPDQSKIGTVAIETPLLDQTLTGGIYLAQQTPEQLLRIYLVAEAAGVLVKLAGDIDPDPVTGQLTATFEDNPELPVSSIDLAFKGGPRAALSNPRACGTATTTASFVPWSGQPAVTRTDSFEVGGPCPGGFNPSFVAGTQNAKAGATSPLTVRFARQDADDMLGGIALDLPNGLLARIADVPLCDEARGNAGTCGAESRIGTVMTAAGPGATPFQLAGPVYLTGPYKGGPFGLSIVVPAKAGPFDLGTVVVRTSILVDRVTTQLRIVSDPLPSILQGIPLQIRTVDVKVDRPGFTFNPTSCKASSTAAAISSLAGAVTGKSSRFQVAGCRALPYKPKLTIRMGTRGRTKAGITAPLNVSLAMTPGQANNKSVAVALPRNVNARLKVINERACTIQQFNSAACPASNRIGTAKAVTPLLKDPLQGDVFFVRNPARRIPDLMVALRGQVAVDLTGKVTVNRNLTLRTEFDTIPDVPITNFSLDLVAGANGPVGFVANACTKAAKNERARISYRSHSGKTIHVRQRLQIAGCTSGRSAKKAAKKPVKK